jgi:FkbM family methyltransferase
MLQIKSVILNYAKTKPRLFDFLKSQRRSFNSGTDPIYSILSQFSKANGHKIFFVQIGANDGLRNDPIRELVIRYKWNGILIEPLPNVFDLLKENYKYLHNKLRFINAAISNGSEDLTFYSFNNEFLSSLTTEEKLNYLRKSSFSREHVESVIERNNESLAILKEIRVPTITIESIYRQYCNNEKIDLLVIDAEGHEPTIIQSINFNILRPTVILFESHNLKENKLPLFEFLKQNDYMIKELGGDSIAYNINKFNMNF